ncbi:MAG: hypothetical protein D6693_05575 [Planctomycetota bacterium]|nr:MAG: hypothetical protein D6693_05575 [Planctomycetota bacterium]
MNNFNWIFWIIVGATALQWVYGKVQEQTELNKAKKSREQARQASLRTGPATSPTPTQRRGPGRAITLTQAELQARRQAQLKALRERQARAAGPAQPRATHAPRPTTTRPVPPRRAQPAPQPLRTPVASRTTDTAPLRRRRPEEAQRAARKRASSAGTRPSQRPSERSPEAAPFAQAGPTASLAPRSRADWRRAIVAAEILAPPVSMREG